jgi:hypothetical protein
LLLFAIVKGAPGFDLRKGFATKKATRAPPSGEIQTFFIISIFLLFLGARSLVLLGE